MRIIQIGFGAMGKGIGKAIQKANEINSFKNELFIVDPNQKNCFNSLYDLNLALSYDAVILSIKPDLIFYNLEEYVSILKDQKLTWISMAGGVKFDFYRRIIKSPTPIIRIMPNLAVEQNAGVIALYSDQDIDSQIVSLFRTMGEVCVTHFEEDIDRITAISGCGLAYVFAFADCLEKAFMEVFKSTFDHLCTSLDQKKVEKIARQTVIGASLMLEHTQEKASKLQKDVASPNGITEEALKILTADDALLPLLTKTIQRAFDRSLEMGNRKI